MEYNYFYSQHLKASFKAALLWTRTQSPTVGLPVNKIDEPYVPVQPG